jgi:5-methylcytosine-specific restriction protein A
MPKREDDTHPTAPVFRSALAGIFSGATRACQQSLRLSAGELHRVVGGYPGANHRMPLCCRVMKQAMQAGDEIVDSLSSGQGPTLTIDYRLPRPDAH